MSGSSDRPVRGRLRLPGTVLSWATIAVLAACGRGREDEEGGGRTRTEPTAPGASASPVPSVERLAERSPAAAGAALFTALDPATCGIDFTNPVEDGHPMARLYYGGFASGAAAIADFDGDGRKDLVLTGGPRGNALYLQKEAPLVFEDATARSGIGGGDRWAAGAVAADIDGDRDVDLVVCHYEAPCSLWLNDGAGVFTDHAEAAGLAGLVDATLLPTVCDYDRDGDLDLYLLTNKLYREGGRPAVPPVVTDALGRQQVKPEFARFYRINQTGPETFSVDDVGRPDYLLRNDGPGTDGVPRFTDATQAAGIDHAGFGLSATWWDYDDDGWPDLYVGNDFSDPDHLYRNRRDGTFVDVARAALPHTSWFSMGADAADVDRDGLDDFLSADMAFTTHYAAKVGMGQMGAGRWRLERIRPLQLMRNALYLNTGMGRFREAAQLAGLARSDWTWAVKFADFDLDGWPDLFVANGSIREFNHSDHPVSPDQLIGRTLWELWKDTPRRDTRNLAFRNTGRGLAFEEVGEAWGLGHVGVSHAIACGDLDDDGDPDLVVTHLEEPVTLYRNDGHSHHRLVVRLEGRHHNRSAVGARVTVGTGSGELRQTVRPSGGFLTTAAPGELVFGLGDDPVIESLVVDWPDGARDVIAPDGLAADTRVVVAQSANGEIPADRRAPRDDHLPLFPPVAILDRAIVHHDPPFDDFAKQPLLPNQLSRLGPRVAIADVDGDGDPDFFLGQGRGTAGQVFLEEGDGRFRGHDLPGSAPFEDQGAAFLDADGDGDADLFVASGSYEFGADDPALGDRLYLNGDGRGAFRPAPPESVPDLRAVSSCACPADFDKDGDPDLFVGGRVVPGAYPSPPASRLLENVSTADAVRFVDVTEARAPALRTRGMVTDGTWADVDGDTWPDLMVTLEWGPVCLFRNREGTLVEETEAAGLADRLGWWTRIAAADVDHDGDIDFAVGNFGLNTKYHADTQHPVVLYYGDYHGDGRPRLVEAEFEGDVIFPVRGKSCSTAAMPQLADRFPTFHDFAKATLADIYSRPMLERADRFECNTLESGFLLNDGSGRFSFQPFPRIAQIAPVAGFAFGDFDEDGHLDLAIAENFHGPQWETGPYDGGVGVVLKGDGSGNFEPLHPSTSGVILPGDARDLHLLEPAGGSRPRLLCPLNNGPVLIQ